MEGEIRKGVRGGSVREVEGRGDTGRFYGQQGEDLLLAAMFEDVEVGPAIRVQSPRKRHSLAGDAAHDAPRRYFLLGVPERISAAGPVALVSAESKVFE